MQRMKSALSIFDYQDYRDFLRAEYDWQKEHNPKFSLRYFALRAKVRSYTSLKYVIERKRHLSHPLLNQFAIALQLDKREAEYFELLWKVEMAVDDSQKSALLLELQRIRTGSGRHAVKIHDTLRRARTYYEKCQFEDSRAEFKKAYTYARQSGESPAMFEALAGMIRVADDRAAKQDLAEVEALLAESFQTLNGHAPPALYWYCRGKLAHAHGQERLAQRYLLSFLRSSRQDPSQFTPAQTFSQASAEACAWVYLANLQIELKRWKRAELLCLALSKKYKGSPLRGVTGYILLYLGFVMETKRDFVLSQLYYENAHSKFKDEQNWYCCLYAMLAYARVSRAKGDYVRAEAYLDLLRKSAPSEFATLNRVLENELSRLKDADVDLAFATSGKTAKVRHLAHS
jgi:hypothetical protein